MHQADAITAAMHDGEWAQWSGGWDGWVDTHVRTRRARARSSVPREVHVGGKEMPGSLRANPVGKILRAQEADGFFHRSIHAGSFLEAAKLHATHLGHDVAVIPTTLRALV